MRMKTAAKVLPVAENILHLYTINKLKAIILLLETSKHKGLGPKQLLKKTRERKTKKTLSLKKTKI